eukprot:6121303-Heterocapsa_arctica.AAC.1
MLLDPITQPNDSAERGGAQAATAPAPGWLNPDPCTVRPPLPNIGAGKTGPGRPLSIRNRREPAARWAQKTRRKP